MITRKKCFHFFGDFNNAKLDFSAQIRKLIEIVSKKQGAEKSAIRKSFLAGERSVNLFVHDKKMFKKLHFIEWKECSLNLLSVPP